MPPWSFNPQPVVADPTNGNGVRPWRPWSPPPDPEKPACPYRTGFAVDIRAHVPPPPFGHRNYGPDPWPSVSDTWLQTATQTELVMKYPPLETPDLLAAPTAQLTILEPLAVADGRGAQLAVCTVAPKAPGQKPFEAVAKVFDPLYYSFADKLVPSVPTHVAWQADADYSREAAAYEHLQKVGQAGGFAPAYYGSWTFTLPIWCGNATLQRSVRLVLIERIAGPTIRDLCLASGVLQYDDAYRLEILAQILDGVIRQVHAGLDQRDLATRNVILAALPPAGKPGTQPQTYPRPVLIDYNNSLVVERTVYGKSPLQLGKLPPNPMEYFWDSPLWAEFEGWTPPEWAATTRLMQEWLARRFGGKIASEYAPVEDKLEFST